MEVHYFIFVIGIAVGVCISNLIHFIQSSYGTLTIDQSKPDKDMYKLEIENLDVLPKKKSVVMKVKVRAANPLK